MFFNNKQKHQSFFKIFSYYNEKVHAEVPKFQKAVFKKFGFSINHIFNKKFTEHGEFLNHICRSVTDTDYLIIFDIDCIPVNKKWIHELLDDLTKPRTIVGAAQTANHLRNGENLYVSPFFFAIATDYLRELNYPEMKMTEDMDGGQNLTECILKNNGNVKYWFPTEIEEEKWHLHHPEHTKFGLGTTYNNAVYHAFFSRDNLSERFIKKCKTILAE